MSGCSAWPWGLKCCWRLCVARPSGCGGAPGGQSLPWRAAGGGRMTFTRQACAANTLWQRNAIEMRRPLLLSPARNARFLHFARQPCLSAGPHLPHFPRYLPGPPCPALLLRSPPAACLRCPHTFTAHSTHAAYHPLLVAAAASTLLVVSYPCPRCIPRKRHIPGQLLARCSRGSSNAPLNRRVPDFFAAPSASSGP